LAAPFVGQLGASNLKITRTAGGRIPVSGPLANTFDKRLLVIGDAAGFTDPIFKGGTYLALKSGSLAASVAIDAIKTKDFSRNHFAHYQKRWQQHFPDYDLLGKGHRYLSGFSEPRLDLAGRYMPDNVEAFSRSQKSCERELRFF